VFCSVNRSLRIDSNPNRRHDFSSNRGNFYAATTGNAAVDRSGFSLSLPPFGLIVLHLLVAVTDQRLRRQDSPRYPRCESAASAKGLPNSPNDILVLNPTLVSSPASTAG
jgi:hypothetical protein